MRSEPDTRRSLSLVEPTTLKPTRMQPIEPAATDGSSRAQMYEVIFGNDTGPGKFFDVVLIVAILLSILTIMLESVQSLSSDYSAWFVGLEWFFTGIFTVEYALRIWSVEKPSRYILQLLRPDRLTVGHTYLPEPFRPPAGRCSSLSESCASCGCFES